MEARPRPDVRKRSLSDTKTSTDLRPRLLNATSVSTYVKRYPHLSVDTLVRGREYGHKIDGRLGAAFAGPKGAAQPGPRSPARRRPQRPPAVLQRHRG